MIECPKCGGLSPTGAIVCGNCGMSLQGITSNSNNINSTATNNELYLYDKEAFNNQENENVVKNKHAAFRFSDIILLILSILSWAFVPIRVVKLGLAFLFFYIAETSNNKNSILLVFTRIITAVQIFGVVIALILKISTSPEIVAKYFEYFKF